MQNSSVIFFGKPDSYESYEFENNKVFKLDYFEPHLKLHQDHNDALHFFKKEHFFYLELYSFARAFNSGRAGVVIGVAIKSEQNISISKKNYDLLKKLLDFYKKSAFEIKDGIQNKMFKEISLINLIKDFKLDYDKIAKEIEYNDAKSKFSNTTLVFEPDFYGKLDQIGKILSEYDDVYLTDSKEVYKATLNKDILFKTKNKFYQISNNQLVEYTEPIKTPPPPPPLPDTIKQLERELINEKNKNINLNNEFIKFKARCKKKVKQLSIALSVLLLTVLVFFFKAVIFPPEQSAEVIREKIVYVKNDNIRDETKKDKREEFKITDELAKKEEFQKFISDLNNSLKDNDDFESVFIDKEALNGYIQIKLFSDILYNSSQFQKTNQIKFKDAVERDCKKLKLNPKKFLPSPPKTKPKPTNNAGGNNNEVNKKEGEKPDNNEGKVETEGGTDNKPESGNDENEGGKNK